LKIDRGLVYKLSHRQSITKIVLADEENSKDDRSRKDLLKSLWYYIPLRRFEGLQK